MKKKNKRKKRAVTLIEIMIVILLIGLIGGALAFNMRGSMDKGRTFKTDQNCARVYDALMMEYSKGELSLDQIIEKSQQIVSKSPFIKDPAKTLKDAWGIDLTIKKSGSDDLIVFSAKAKALNDAQKIQ